MVQKSVKPYLSKLQNFELLSDVDSFYPILGTPCKRPRFRWPSCCNTTKQTSGPCRGWRTPHRLKRTFSFRWVKVTLPNILVIQRCKILAANPCPKLLLRPQVQFFSKSCPHRLKRTFSFRWVVKDVLRYLCKVVKVMEKYNIALLCFRSFRSFGSFRS